MPIETGNAGIPPSEYYEKPYLPSANEAREFSKIPLLPVEALTILVNNAGKPMSVIDRLALQKISESDDSDVHLDLKAMRRQIAAELDADDDWE
jgi:hypothetical protein